MIKVLQKSHNFTVTHSMHLAVFNRIVLILFLVSVLEINCSSLVELPSYSLPVKNRGGDSSKISNSIFNSPVRKVKAKNTRNHSQVRYARVSEDFAKLRSGHIPSMEDSNPLLIRQARQSITRSALATWGVFNVVVMLLQSVFRLYPVAIQPFYAKDFDSLHWALYGLWVAFMLYAEGYKGFYLKFSPFVVQRAFALIDRPNILNVILAGPYCMGLFGATRKRLTISWSLVAAVVGMVVLVKRLQYPYKAIVDAGVVAGLSFGAASVVLLFFQALMGKLPDVDPCFPTSASGSDCDNNKQKAQ